MNVALITARAGSKSIIHKNLLMLCGKPLMGYNLEASQNSKLIDKVYVSTDGAEIAKVGEDFGAETILRPKEISRDESPHWECIEHGVKEISTRHKNLKNVVVLLGNTAMVSSEDIDACLQKLEDEAELTGVLTVWEAQDDHPFRALYLDDKGWIKPFLKERGNVSTNRQSYPKVYFYDQGVWAFRAEWAFKNEGPSPWTWMGPRCGYIVRPWMAGRDVHGEFDLEGAKWWISTMKK